MDHNRSKGSPRPGRLDIVNAKTPEQVALHVESAFRLAKFQISKLIEVKVHRTVANTLLPFDEAVRLLSNVADQGRSLFYVHPGARVREAGDRAYQAANGFLNELKLNRAVYEAVRSLDTSELDAETKYAVTKVLREFQRAGVDRDEPTRAKIKMLNDEITAIGAEFEKNISDDVRSVELDGPQLLEGLPDDFILSHTTKDGKVVITTAYPDALPVLKYCANADVRRRLMWEFYNRGYPKNIEVLDRLLSRRHELAKLLGYVNYAEYATEDKMVGSAKAATDFVEQVEKAAVARSEVDYRLLLERKRKDLPEATGIDPWDYNYYVEKVRAERYRFDSREVRPYFEFSAVLRGLLTITGRLFDVKYKRVNKAAVWHESVQVYDVYHGRHRIGRFFLDLHPREGKFTHAASGPLLRGLKGRQLPQVILLANFPDPSRAKGPALMEHSDVVTFFHEFGHLLHSIFSGRCRWMKTTQDEVEWDFIEVPSMLLEEWARRPESLNLFARHFETGEPMPVTLLDSMIKAQTVARGLQVKRQVFFAALSLAYYSKDPAGIDTTALALQLNERYFQVPWYRGTHFQCSFGHLMDYSAVYYTYLWSDVIAKDFFGEFAKRGSAMDLSLSKKLRRDVLQAASARPAVEMVRSFLGRDFTFEAFEAWLNEGSA